MAEKTIDIASPILSRNERLADQLRQRFNEAGTYVINVLSSPGSGKTTTILGTNERLRDKAGLRCAVIEGDIASDVDAITMKEAGMPAIQINTGGLCHLEGNMIMEAVDPPAHTCGRCRCGGSRLQSHPTRRCSRARNTRYPSWA